MIRVAVTSARTHLAGRATAALVASMLLVVGGAVSATADGGGTGTGTGSTGVADPVPTTTHITCESPQTFTGKALTPCTATVTAKDGSKTWSVPVSYQDNVNAGTAHVSAGLADVAGYQGSNAFSTFTINKAPTSTRISCPSVVPYTGQPVEPSSAALLMGTQLGELSVRYRDNTGPGIAYATAMFPGDSNYTASGADQTFLIGGPTTVTVTCASGSTYTGSALTPCTATAKADDGFSSTPLIVTFGNNVNAGTATATATYAGDGAGHLGSTGTATFTIAKAPSVVTVECAPASVVYTGAAFTPCTSTVTGAGTLAAAVAPVTYSSNTSAGTATAAATYAGDSNHLGATGSTTFTIEKAPVVVSLICPASADFTGATLTPAPPPPPDPAD